MNILITHIRNSLNYGSAMMAINTIHYFKKIFPDANFYCQVNDFHLNRFIEATDCYDLKAFPDEPHLLYGKNLLKHLKFHFLMAIGKEPYCNHIKVSKIDLIIVLGGDDFSSQGSLTQTPNNMRINQYINKHICKVIYLCHNMGPYHGFREKLYRQLLNGPCIITRDNFSFVYLTQQLNLKNVIESRDLAFLPLPNLADTVAVIPKEIFQDPYITLVPSGAIAYYKLKTMDVAIDAWTKVAQLLLTKFPDHNIVLLSHVYNVNSSNNDATLINGIYTRLDKISRLKPITSLIQPLEARRILGGADFVFTARMHPSISSYSQRRIAVNFAYSQKYFGVIAESLQLPELIIDARKLIVGSDAFLKELNATIDNIVENKHRIEDIISHKVNHIQKMVQDTINKIFIRL